ncbi:MAG: hypothetical protein JXB47_19305 [Anaerolineae bacterium]|nr:hypothetical protein [Anaerolineae bacterium]
MLYQSDAEVLFPARVIPLLRDLRGGVWCELIDKVIEAGDSHPDTLAFGLMMIRLDGCMTCHADSYRAMRGCSICARQAVARFKGSDHELVLLWERARAEIDLWLETGISPDIG